ncbi:hypothetical protein Kisp01_22390 [Kineosporia sp. NBRC 101677]|nr:hypothetical protein Kisp01_22390 [Kineosporia sp. NBRC 101677]
MTDEHVRVQTPGLGQPEKRHLQGEKGGLGVTGAGRVTGQGLGQRTGQQRIQLRGHLVPGRGEDRESLMELTPHARALRPLAGEDEGQAVARALTAHHPGVGLPGRQGTQNADQIAGRGGEHGGTVLEGGARSGRRTGDVQRPDCVVLVDPVGELGGLGP